MDRHAPRHSLRRRLRRLCDGGRWVYARVLWGLMETRLSVDPPPGEVQFADQVSLAVRTIREARLPVWFEPDVASAREIQRQCADCRVFAPTGHLRVLPDD